MSVEGHTILFNPQNNNTYLRQESVHGTNKMIGNDPRAAKILTVSY